MKKQVLTIREANRLAKGRAKVSVDPEDARLWRVEADGWVEAHEPMGRLAWQTFLAEKVGDPADEPTPTSGRHEMVAYSGEQTAVLGAVLRDVLSPQALAVIALYLREGDPASSDDRVNGEVWWFLDLVTDLLGGYDRQVALAAEVGL